MDIDITEPDMPNYNNKMSMLYIVGYETELTYYYCWRKYKSINYF